MEAISIDKEGHFLCYGVSIGTQRKDIPVSIRGISARYNSCFNTITFSEIPLEKLKNASLIYYLNCYERVCRIEFIPHSEHNQLDAYYETTKGTISSTLSSIGRYNSRDISNDTNKGVVYDSGVNELSISLSQVLGPGSYGIITYRITEQISPCVKQKQRVDGRRLFKVVAIVILVVYGFLFLLNNRYETVGGKVVLDKWQGKYVEMEIKRLD